MTECSDNALTLSDYFFRGNIKCCLEFYRKLRRQEVAKGEHNRSNDERVTDLIDHAVPTANICDIARSGKVPD